MAASKTTKKRKSKTASRQQDTGNRFQTEILILVMFAACLILMISAFGMGGIVGNAISSICFGIMGLCAYLFPIVLFGGVTFLIVNNKNRLAYKKIFARLGINYRVVKASTGSMGGILSEEFQAITDIGEDTLVFCEACEYASNLEVCESISDEKERGNTRGQTP